MWDTKTSTAISEFSKHDWTNSEGWKKYAETIFPSPTPEELLNHRIKWFKENVNDDLPLDFYAKMQELKETYAKMKNQPQQGAPGQKFGMIKEFLFTVEAVAKLLFFVTIVLQPKKTLLAATVVSCLGLFRQNGFLKWAWSK